MTTSLFLVNLKQYSTTPGGSIRFRLHVFFSTSSHFILTGVNLGVSMDRQMNTPPDKDLRGGSGLVRAT